MKTRSIGIAILSLLLAGCGVEPSTLDSLRDAVRNVSSQGASPTDSSSERVDSLFEPPHPERVDPFSFPSEAADTDRAGTGISSVAEVEVLGFADVDEPRVFLRTKETTKSFKVGERIDGVEVIAIHPPAVELRMGNLVWSATMFDKSSMTKE